jgi:HK97 family phage prohead protease
MKTTLRRAVTGSVTKFLSTVGERQIRVIASDATPDRMGDILEPAGCQLDKFRRNPIMLAQHDPNQPIGVWPSIEVKNGRLEALGEFAPEGVSELADEYCALAKSGVINAVSVGFISLAREPLREGGWRFTQWELIELSLVSVPANPNALVIERSLDQQGREPTMREVMRDAGQQIGRIIVAARLRAALPPRRTTLEERIQIARELRRGE